MSPDRRRGGAARGCPQVLIAGGGVAALEAMLALSDLARARVAVELLSPDDHFRYRPMAVAQPFGLGRVERVELAALAAEHGAGVRVGALATVDAKKRQIRTRAGETLSYDALVVAIGAEPREALPGALSFRGALDSPKLRELLAELESGAVRDVVFVMPGGPRWPLPLYELALMTAAHLAMRHVTGARLTLVTPEAAPLELFGTRAGEEVRRLLAAHRIELVTGCTVSALEGGQLKLVPEGALPADRVVALPRLAVAPVAGLPQDDDGFLAVDRHGRVVGLRDVYAAGDVTSFPVKHGGLAAQQADTVAESIAAWSGAPVEATPFRPVLRGQLMTAAAPRYPRSDPTGGGEDASQASLSGLWWPPTKIAGRYLAPVLAVELDNAPPPGLYPQALRLEIDLEEIWRRHALADETP